MTFKPYTPHEIFDYFDAINCKEDVRVVSQYLADNVNDYSIGENAMFFTMVKEYAELFSDEKI
jgi:hypothetical protein